MNVRKERMVVMLQQQHVRIILVALRVLAILVMNLLQDHRPCAKVSVYGAVLALLQFWCSFSANRYR